MAKYREHLSHFHIAGFSYYDGVFAFNDMKVGSELVLKLEEDNKYDPKAVAVYFKNHKLGFIPRADNDIFYKLLKVGFKGISCHVQRLSPEEHPEEQVQVVAFLHN